MKSNLVEQDTSKTSSISSVRSWTTTSCCDADRSLESGNSHGVERSVVQQVVLAKSSSKLTIAAKPVHTRIIGGETPHDNINDQMRPKMKSERKAQFSKSSVRTCVLDSFDFWKRASNEPTKFL